MKIRAVWLVFEGESPKFVPFVDLTGLARLDVAVPIRDPATKPTPCYNKSSTVDGRAVRSSSGSWFGL